MNKLKRTFVIFLTLIISVFMINTIYNISSEASSAPTIKFDNNGKITGTIKDLDDKKTTLNKLLSEYRTIITFLSGIGSFSMIVFFVMNLIALGNSKGNPQERQKAITGLIVSAIATAGLGSVTLISGLFYNMLGL